MFTEALFDIVDGCKKWNFWVYSAWLDIKKSYRGSLIGPFWITISLAVFVSCLTVVYGKLFNQSGHSYTVYLICGFINWYFISQNINSAPSVFLSNSPLITEVKLPFTIFIYKQIVRGLIIYAHNFLVYLGLLLILQFNPGWNVLLAIPGLLLNCLLLTFLVLCVGMLATRFRDMAQIVTTVVQILFFVSPVTWMPSMIGVKSKIVNINPITYMLEVIRDPLMGVVPPFQAWAVLIALTILSSIIGFILFAKYRDRIPYWVV